MAAVHPETALVPFMRGELAGAQRDRVAQHLEGCAECRASAQSLHGLLAELSTRLDELPQPDWGIYQAQLRRKLAERSQPRPRWWRPGVVWGGLAVTAATAVLALWLTLPGSRPSLMPAADDQLALEQQMDIADVGLLRNYAVVQRLDLLENYDVIEHLDELRPSGKPSDALRS